jgi:hypothetical protein
MPEDIAGIILGVLAGAGLLAIALTLLLWWHRND